MKKSINLISLIFCLMLYLTSFSLAIEVTAIGEGHTRQEAINNGIRVAIEKALGTYIKSQTEISQGRLIYDRIVSASAGYVRNYKVLVEGKDPITDIYKVKLLVFIDDYKLKNVLKKFKEDPRFRRVFQEIQFEEKRIIVIYMPRTSFDLPANSKAVQTVMDLIEDKLVEYGFRVFLHNKIWQIQDEKAAIKVAREEGGDVVILVSLDTGIRSTYDGYYLIKATLTLKAYDVTTGELFANVQDTNKTITWGSDYGIQDGVTRIVLKIGPRCVNNFIRKIVNRFSTIRAKFVVLIFRNISPNDQDKIENLLNEIGWRYRIAYQTGNYIEIEIFCEADPASVRRVIRKRLKAAGLSFIPIEMVGSKITFDKNYIETY